MTTMKTTMKQSMITLLEEHGMWPQDAEKIFEVFEKSDVVNAMLGRWGDDVSAYGSTAETLIKVNWFSLRRVAAAWLTEHQPQHWARLMFEHEKD